MLRHIVIKNQDTTIIALDFFSGKVTVGEVFDDY